MRSSRLLLGLLVILYSVNSVAAERIVSLNACYDQLLYQWVPDKLVGVTRWSDTSVAPQVSRHRGDVESIVALNPDKVIANQFTQPQLLQALQPFTEVVVVEQPQRWRDYADFLQALGQASGAERQASEQLQQSQSLLERLRQLPAKSILSVMANQYSWGRETWFDSVMTALGWKNLAAKQGTGLVSLRLEQVLQLAPDIVLWEGSTSTAFALANQWLYHPVMQRWREQQHWRAVSSEIASCPAVRWPEYIRAITQSD